MLNNQSSNLTNSSGSSRSSVSAGSTGSELGARLSGRTALKYRPDIDGLRAVAVLSVLAFHIGLHGTQGGFVGVDVFFVISGYLISWIVFTEVAGSRYSLIGFYERRIRRIFSALFAMLAVFSVFQSCICCRLSWWLMVSQCWRDGFSFQFLFLATFRVPDSPTSYPLLHTWSLAVEEQFYISFPLFLVLVRKFFPYPATSVGDRFVLCLVGCQRGCRFPESRNRFLYVYTRAWESCWELLSLQCSRACNGHGSGILQRWGNRADRVFYSFLHRADAFSWS